MAKELILAKYGEMALKGLNRGTFEDILMKNLRRRLKKFGAFKLNRAQSTIYMEPLSDTIDLDEVLEQLQCVFGIAALCRACVCEKTMEDISAKAVSYLEEVLQGANTFKVEAKRADKAFPLKSPEICAELGGILLDAYPHLSVDVHHPDVTVMVEIRDTHAFVHGANLKGAGGLPVGSSGKALLLLSGGIDSPVAGYRMARRGVHISAIHYVSPPYTSDRAQEKVEQLCQELTPYCGNIAFFCVPFTEHPGGNQEVLSGRVFHRYYAAADDGNCTEDRCKGQLPGADYRRERGTGGKPDHAGDRLHRCRQQDPGIPSADRFG